jgi:hypothetical protein
MYAEVKAPRIHQEAVRLRLAPALGESRRPIASPWPSLAVFGREPLRNDRHRWQALGGPSQHLRGRIYLLTSPLPRGRTFLARKSSEMALPDWLGAQNGQERTTSTGGDFMSRSLHVSRTAVHSAATQRMFTPIPRSDDAVLEIAQEIIDRLREPKRL